MFTAAQAEKVIATNKRQNYIQDYKVKCWQPIWHRSTRSVTHWKKTIKILNTVKHFVCEFVPGLPGRSRKIPKSGTLHFKVYTHLQNIPVGRLEIISLTKGKQEKLWNRHPFPDFVTHLRFLCLKSWTRRLCGNVYEFLVISVVKVSCNIEILSTESPFLFQNKLKENHNYQRARK